MKYHLKISQHMMINAFYLKLSSSERKSSAGNLGLAEIARRFGDKIPFAESFTTVKYLATRLIRKDQIFLAYTKSNIS